MIFGTLKQFIVKSFWFQAKGTLETYTVEFVEKMHVTVVQPFFALASVIYYEMKYTRFILIQEIVSQTV